MLAVSDAYKAAMLRPVKTWDISIKITLANADSFYVGKTDIILGSTQYTEGSTCTDTIQVGSTFSNGFDFALLNHDGRYSDYDFKDAKVEPTVGLLVEEPSTYEYIPLGIFYVLESPKKLSTISISCLDKMSRTNVPFEIPLTAFPANAAEVLEQACVLCDINLSDAFYNAVAALDLEVHSFETSNLTCRDIIASAGTLIAANVRFNRDGVLEHFWYAASEGATTSDNRIGQSSYDDQMVQVTKVIISDNYNQAYALGDDGYEVETYNNPFIQDASIAETVLMRVLEKLNALTYHTCSVTAVGDPSYQAGDIVTHYRDNFEDYTVPLMKIIYKFGGSMQLETIGSFPEVLQQQTLFDRKLINLSNKNNKGYTDLETQIVQTESRIMLAASQTYVTSDQVEQKLNETIVSIGESFEVQVTGLNTKLQDNVDSLQADIDAVDQDLQNKYQEITTTFQVTSQGAIVGKAGSKKQVVINDSSVTIEVDGQAASTFSDKGANMPEATVDVLHIGNVTIKYNERDGHVTFS